MGIQGPKPEPCFYVLNSDSRGLQRTYLKVVSKLAVNHPSKFFGHTTYANRPDLTALRVRQLVYGNTTLGREGNDNSGAMAAHLIFHLLGLYPVPASRQLLLSTPFLSSYTLHNGLLGTGTTVTVSGFDLATLVKAPPTGSRLYVQSVTINGKSEQFCVLDPVRRSRWRWSDRNHGGRHLHEQIDGWGSASNSSPSSLESGGF
uniref:Glycosyl hydrolase family 92 domain-containing protein n=1 Tax=Psilocybe cubensis TaxID=181762 RepID=A0A8H7Y0Z8_PSICU